LHCIALYCIVRYSVVTYSFIIMLYILLFAYVIYVYHPPLSCSSHLSLFHSFFTSPSPHPLTILLISSSLPPFILPPSSPSSSIPYIHPLSSYPFFIFFPLYFSQLHCTAGDHMWTHDSDESVRSALNTRYVRTNTQL
jgi:hypothetical protein